MTEYNPAWRKCWGDEGGGRDSVTFGNMCNHQPSGLLFLVCFSLWHHPCKYWIYLQMKFTTFSLLISFLPPHSQCLECHVQFKLGVSLQGPRVRIQELNPQLLGFYLIPDRLCSWGISQTTFPPQRKICLWTLTLTFLWSCKIINPILAFSVAVSEHYLNSPPGTQKFQRSKASFK